MYKTLPGPHNSQITATSINNLPGADMNLKRILAGGHSPRRTPRRASQRPSAIPIGFVEVAIAQLGAMVAFGALKFLLASSLTPLDDVQSSGIRAFVQFLSPVLLLSNALLYVQASIVAVGWGGKNNARKHYNATLEQLTNITANNDNTPEHDNAQRPVSTVSATLNLANESKIARVPEYINRPDIKAPTLSVNISADLTPIPTPSQPPQPTCTFDTSLRHLGSTGTPVLTPLFPSPPVLGPQPLSDGRTPPQGQELVDFETLIKSLTTRRMRTRPCRRRFTRVPVIHWEIPFDSTLVMFGATLNGNLYRSTPTLLFESPHVSKDRPRSLPNHSIDNDVSANRKVVFKTFEDAFRFWVIGELDPEPGSRLIQDTRAVFAFRPLWFLDVIDKVLGVLVRTATRYAQSIQDFCAPLKAFEVELDMWLFPCFVVGLLCVAAFSTVDGGTFSGISMGGVIDDFEDDVLEPLVEEDLGEYDDYESKIEDDSTLLQAIRLVFLARDVDVLAWLDTANRLALRTVRLVTAVSSYLDHGMRNIRALLRSDRFKPRLTWPYRHQVWIDVGIVAQVYAHLATAEGLSDGFIDDILSTQPEGLSGLDKVTFSTQNPHSSVTICPTSGSSTCDNDSGELDTTIASTTKGKGRYIGCRLSESNTPLPSTNRARSNVDIVAQPNNETLRDRIAATQSTIAIDQQVVAHKVAVLMAVVTSLNEYGRSFKNWAADALAVCVSQNAKTLQTISEETARVDNILLNLTERIAAFEKDRDQEREARLATEKKLEKVEDMVLRLKKERREHQETIAQLQQNVEGLQELVWGDHHYEQLEGLKIATSELDAAVQDPWTMSIDFEVPAGIDSLETFNSIPPLADRVQGAGFEYPSFSLEPVPQYEPAMRIVPENDSKHVPPSLPHILSPILELEESPMLPTLHDDPFSSKPNTNLAWTPEYNEDHSAAWIPPSLSDSGDLPLPVWIHDYQDSLKACAGSIERAIDSNFHPATTTPPTSPPAIRESTNRFRHQLGPSIPESPPLLMVHVPPTRITPMLSAQDEEVGPSPTPVPRPQFIKKLKIKKKMKKFAQTQAAEAASLAEPRAHLSSSSTLPATSEMLTSPKGEKGKDAPGLVRLYVAGTQEGKAGRRALKHIDSNR